MPSNPNEFIHIVPYVRLESGWSVTDEMMARVFLAMKEEGKVERVFFSSKVESSIDFIARMREPGTYPILLIDNKDLYGVAWLNNVADNNAMVHFCLFKAAKAYTDYLALLAHRYWRSWKHPVTGKPILDVFIGIIPSVNKAAILAAKRSKYIELGTIPKILLNVHTGARAGMTILYRLEDDT